MRPFPFFLLSEYLFATAAQKPRTYLRPLESPSITDTSPGETVLAGGIAAFALTDMILHNRRKRAAFYAEQHALYASRLIAAVETERAGLPLTDDQTLVLNRERAKIAAEEERKRASWWGGVKGVFVGGLKSELDGAEEKGGVALLSEAEVLERVGVAPMEVLEAADGKTNLDAEMGRGDRRVDWQSEGRKRGAVSWRL